jgi:glucose/arabinose dehydrogenase
MKRLISALTAAFIMLGLTTENANAQVNLPTGFSQVLVAGGITAPTTMAQAPDGRFFIAQQNGILRVVKNGILLPQPFVSLNVNTDGERGLLGVAFDPSFAVNQYVYLCYTVASGAYNRVSRFVASGDTAVPGSETLILQLDTLIANYHGGGHLDFGPDGKLYIAAGENGRSAQAQVLDSYLGKILRVNPDGSVPVDNPFPGPGKRQRVWAYGLRNPFTFTFQPGTGRMFINDVGEITWEEINDATTAGNNFGWPTAEGFSTDTNFVNPFYNYHHGTALGEGCAITGGTFFNPDSTNYPSTYLNNYFYIDYCGNWIDYISLTNPPTWTNFASNISQYVVGLLTGHDGNLYYLSRNDEALYKISYSTNTAPLIVNDPQSQTISLGYPVTFYVTASGNNPLNYQWRKGTSNIPGATGTSYTIPSVAFADSGNYNVVVTNSFGSTTSSNAHLTVTANQPPAAVISTPSNGMLYTAGETINFSGSATDPEDGTLAAGSMDWLVEFHHNTHIHPGPTAGTGISSGSFTIPDVGEKSTNVYYRLWLIVTDSDGMTDSSYVDLFPRTSTITLNTVPSGIQLTVDGSPVTTPYSVLSVEGMIRTIGAPISSNNLLFTHWNNNGQVIQEIVTPADDSVYTAYFSTEQFNISLGNDLTVCVDDSVTIDAGSSYFSYAWTTGDVTRTISLTSSVEDTVWVGVTVTNSSGAAANDSVMVIFDICSGLSNVSNESIVIYPNPSKGEIKIAGLTTDGYLNILDMTGKLVINNEKIHPNQVITKDLPEGTYLVTIRSYDQQLLVGKRITIIK